MNAVKSRLLLVAVAVTLVAGPKLEAAYPLNVTAGANRPWLPDAMGYNGKMQGDPWRTLPFSNTNLINVLDRSKVNTFRYPGGTVANYWDWVNGREYGSTGNYKPNNLKLAYDQIGFTPSFVVNLLTPTNNTVAQRLTNALNLLTNAAFQGMPIKRVELGNEFYLSDPDYVAEFPTGVEYGQRCQSWIAAIKAKYPAAKCAIAVTMQSYARTGPWTAEVLSACSNYDALVVHWYPQSGLQPSVVDGDGTLAEQNAQWTLFNATNGVDIMLGQPNQEWNAMTAANNVPTNADIWVTEFNLKDSNGAVRQTWANGLFVANQIHAYLKDGRVSVIMLHNWLSSNKQAMYGTNDALDHVVVSHGQGSLATTPYQFGAAGQVMRLFAEVADGATTIAPVNIQSSPQVFTPGVAPYAAVYGWRFTAGGTNRAIFVNSSSTDYTLNLAGVLPTNAHLRQVSGNPRRYITGENATLTRVTSVDTPNVLRLPAYSVTTVGGPADPAPTGSSPNPPALSSNPILKPGVSAYTFYDQTLTNSASDPNGDKLSFKKISGPAWLSVWSDGRISGTPDNANVGTNFWTVQVKDTAGRSNQAVLQITVNIGAPPLPSPVTTRAYGVAEDTFIYSGAEADNPQTLDEFLDVRSTNSASFSRVPYLKFNVDELPGTVTNVLLNIYSVDVSAPVTVFSNSPNWSAPTLTWNNRPGFPSFGTALTNRTVSLGWNQFKLPLAITTTGNLSFALNESANVLEQFTSSRGTNPPYLQLGFAIAPITNQPPPFTNNPFSKPGATEDAAYAGQTLAGSAADGDGHTLFYFKQSGPAWLSIAVDGALSGTPANDDVGTNSWVVQVTDGLATNTATLNIVITNVNDAPVFTTNQIAKPDSAEDSPYTGQTLAGSATDIDAGTTLNYSKVSGPAWLNVAADGALSGTPANAHVGTNVWTVQASDGIAADNATLTIIISNAPVIIPPTLSITPTPPGSVTISWSPPAPGWMLQENLNLHSTNWTDLPSGTNTPTVQPASEVRMYYRLIKQ